MKKLWYKLTDKHEDGGKHRFVVTNWPQEGYLHECDTYCMHVMTVCEICKEVRVQGTSFPELR